MKSCLGIVLAFLLLQTTASAQQVEIKDGSLSISLNGVHKIVQAGDQWNLAAGDIFCVTEGSGRAIVNKIIQLEPNSKKSCFQQPLEIHAGMLNKFLTQIKSTFRDTRSKAVPGVSRSANVAENGDNIKIPLHKTLNFILLSSEDWESIPLILEVLDEKGNLRFRQSSALGQRPLFKIDLNALTEGDTLRISSPDRPQNYLLSQKINFVDVSCEDCDAKDFKQLLISYREAGFLPAILALEAQTKVTN